jgi:hypothetical protein
MENSIPNSVKNTCLEASIYRLRRPKSVSDFSSWRPDGSIERPNDQLCNHLSITHFTHFHIKTVSGQCCPKVWTVTTWLHVIALSRTTLWRVLPWSPDGCRLYARISLSRISTSRRCCLVVRMGAGCLPTLCLERKARIFLNSEERPEMLPGSSDGFNLKIV